MQEEPTLRPSCIGSTGDQKFSSQSLTTRGGCCQLTPSCPKVESSVSSELKLAFNLEMKFPAHQDFYFCMCSCVLLCWDGGNRMCPSSPCSSRARLRCFRLILCSGMRLLMAICSLRPIPSSRGSAGQSAPTISITQDPAPGTESHRGQKLELEDTCVLQPTPCFSRGRFCTCTQQNSRQTSHTFLYLVSFPDNSSRALYLKPDHH